MTRVCTETVVWEVGSLFITVNALEGLYTLCGVDGPLCTYRGRGGLRAAYDAAVAMVSQEVNCG